MHSDRHITWWNVKTQKQMEMILMVLSEQSEEHDQVSRQEACEFDTRNLARMGNNLWKSEEYSGNDNQADTEGMVLIASPDKRKGS